MTSAPRLLGDLEHALREVLVLVEDRVVGAERPAGRRLVLAADGHDHGRGAERLGELDRRGADARGAAVHEQGLAGLQARPRGTR